MSTHSKKPQADDLPSVGNLLQYLDDLHLEHEVAGGRATDAVATLALDAELAGGEKSISGIAPFQ
jgi:hypothetical protein